MSILSWLKDVHNHGASATKMEFAAGEEEFNGLNMKDALDAHEKWYHRLESKINGTSQEQLEVATVACDDKCVLGKWIYSSGKSNFGHMSEYSALKQVHADFHLAAGEINFAARRDGKFRYRFSFGNQGS